MVYLIDTYISSDIQIQKSPIHISDQIQKENEEIDETEEKRSKYMSGRFSVAAPSTKIFFNTRRKKKRTEAD